VAVRVSETVPQRLLLYFTVGATLAGSPQSHPSLIAKLCRVGRSALSLELPARPEFPFPACFARAVDAYRFLIAKAYPPESVVLAGDGAGGGPCGCDHDGHSQWGLPMPAGSCRFSPWADLTLSGWSIMENARERSIMSWDRCS